MQYMFFDTALNGYYTLTVLKNEFPVYMALINSDENISDDNAPFVFQFDEKKLAAVLLMPHVSLKEIILMESEETIISILNHFSRFVVQNIKGKQFYFRFWAASVFKKYITSCNAIQLKDFFGLIKQFSCSDENPSFKILFSFDGNKLITKKATADIIFASTEKTNVDINKENNTTQQQTKPKRRFFY